MTAFLRGVLVAVVAVVFVAFAVANRQAVTLSFDPLPYSLTLPLFVVVLIVLAIGVVVGGTVSWLRGHKWRKLARELGDRVARLERERRRLEEKAEEPKPPALVE